MRLPLFILKTKPPPVANLVITETTLFLPLFFALQVLLIVYWINRNHRDKLILLFLYSMVVVAYSIYSIAAMRLTAAITKCVIVCAIEFFIILGVLSDAEKQKIARGSSMWRINWNLVLIWFGVLIVIVCAMFWRQIYWYL